MGIASYAGGTVAALMVLKKQEDEEKTKYSSEDLKDWEFKILRSFWGAFKNSEKLKKILEEESQSGWELVERLDDSRIRLKRKRDQQYISKSKVDPYRTNYDSPVLAAMCFFIALGVAAVFVSFIVDLLFKNL